MATRVVRGVGLAFGLILAVVLILKLFRVGTPAVPMFHGESPPERVPTTVAPEDNVALIYLKARPLIEQARISGYSWGEERLEPDFLERFAPVLDVLTEAARSERDGFSVYPHGPDDPLVKQGSWLLGVVLRTQYFDLGRRAIKQDVGRGRWEDACRRVEELACLGGHLTTLDDPHDGLRCFLILAVEEPALAQQELSQLPTAGLRSLLKKLNSVREVVTTPLEFALSYRDMKLAAYRQSDSPTSRAEKIQRDYHDLIAVAYSQGSTRRVAEIREKLKDAWKDSEFDLWVTNFWPAEHDAMMDVRQALGSEFRMPTTSGLTQYAVFDGLRFRIAAELYRREHGDYPTSMDQLVPELMPKAPTDPFAPEQSLKFDGTHLWSIGWDGEDQQGQVGIDVMTLDPKLEQPGDYILWTRPSAP